MKTPISKNNLGKPKINREVSDNLPSWLPFCLMGFTLLIYLKAIYNGFTNFDDDFYIINNPFIKDFSWNGVNAIFSSFYQANYHPLTTLVYLFEYRLFAFNPLPYHLLNVVLHILNVWLVYQLVELHSKRQVVALIVALLFAVHPMHVESVAWVSELKDVLYASFFLLALISYLRYIKSDFQMNYYWAALVLFLMSLFSKSAAVTLPVILIAIDAYWGRKFTVKSILEKIPFLLPALLFGVIAILSQKAQGSINDLASSYNLGIRFFFFTAGLSFYFVSLIAPFNLSAMHYYPVVHEGTLPIVYYASPLVLLVVLWFVIRKSPLRKEILFGMAFFLIAISVMLQIIAVGSALTADRYTYLSYIGLFYIVGQWIVHIKSTQLRNTSIGILTAFIILFSIQTYARIDTWNDSTTLVEDIIDHNKDIYFGYWLRGNYKKSTGDIQGALQDYTKAIEKSPKVDDAYFNRGIIFDKLGDPKAAVQDFSKAIQLNSKSADAYNNRGWAYFELHQVPEALKDFDLAISLNEKYAQAHNNRGWLYYKTGNQAAALKDFDKAIEYQPEFLTAYFNRALLNTDTKNYNAAFADYDYLLKIQPKNPNIFYNLGVIYLEMKDTATACKEFNTARYCGSDAALEMMQKYCH